MVPAFTLINLSLELSTKNYFKKDYMNDYFYLSGSAIILLILIMTYFFSIKRKLDYTKLSIKNVMKYYQEDTNKLFTLFCLYTIKLYVFVFLSQEISKLITRSSLDKVLIVIFNIWSLFGLLMTIRILSSSLIKSKLKGKISLACAADDIIISLGKIYFAAFFYPFSFLANVTRKVKVNKKSHFRYLQIVWNVLIGFLESITFGIVSMQQEYALQSAYYYNISFLSGVKESDKMLKNKTVRDLYHFNTLWIVFLPIYVIFVYYGYKFIENHSTINEYKNVALFVIIANIMLLIEFTYYSCNALAFYYIKCKDEFLNVDAKMYDVYNTYTDENDKVKIDDIIEVDKLMQKDQNHQVIVSNA
ncbi:hypothetical protein GVAV_001444 [Gurleya vavrai]